MSLTSYLANKCFELLLTGQGEESGTAARDAISVKRGQAKHYPPWIRDIQYFKQNCDGCGDCIRQCEKNILVLADTGFPVVDMYKGGCSFCGNCAKACSKDLFDYSPSRQPWQLKAFITDDCLCCNNVLCRTCVEHCNEGAVIVSQENGRIGAPRIVAEKCNGCGACFSPCPVGAIGIETNAEEQSP